ncbi:hypothetical protein N0O92_08865 [Alkalihalobacillus sp. MEB130]|uniref:hypothetical protein n=1 Tax=Alkalihalobacillus sp. MEB130 TaxID=2976704 RepID=UPI0028DD61DB|nr:hypothetical protein [Alkalihalobacillus sp. MEB130]MDT8860343.1 hypothetical protein [Alkalihalobacillus sp. MEB130]
MYIIANTEKHREKFMATWQKIAKSRQLPISSLHDDSEAFILQDKDGRDVGTLEFVPCSSSEQDIDLIDISDQPIILENLAYSYQVRKMGISKESTSKKVLLDLLKLAATHAKEKKVRFYLSYLEKRHYEKLTEQFKFRIDLVGEEVKVGKKVLVPALIDVDDAITNTQGYPLHIKSIVYMVRGTKKVKSLFA